MLGPSTVLALAIFLVGLVVGTFLTVAIARLPARRGLVPMSWPYPVVEAVTGVLFTLAFWRFGMSPALLPALVLLAALIVITGIDLGHQLIPDRITLPGIAVGLAANIVTGQVPWVASVIGAVVGAIIFFAIIVTTRGGMGGGDMKLAAMLGAFLGWRAGLFAFFVAIMLGSVVS